MIALRKFSYAGIDQLISWVTSPELLKQFAGPDFTFPLTQKQIKNLMRHPDRILYTVVELPGEKAIGHAEIYLAQENTFLCRIIIGDEQMRGKGIGLQIVKKLLAIAFNEMNRPRVELNVYAWNENAIQCYRKAGFNIVTKKEDVQNSTDDYWKGIRMGIDREAWENQNIDEMRNSLL